jgi:hypothetical protein
MMLSSILTGALLFIMTMTNVQMPESVPFDSDRWQWKAKESRVVDHLGRQSLYLKGGIATVAGASLTNGSIEFDVAFPDERGFIGGIWRVQDPRNYEEFYLRPHQSGNPDANQYTPVFNGVWGWQLYHGGKYSVPVAYRFNDWTRVKILFTGTQAEIYVGDMDQPALFVDELKRGVETGGVGVSALDFAPGHFSNFSFMATDAPPIQGHPQKPEPVPDHVLTSWWISDAFRESSLEDKTSLGPDDLAQRRWTRLATERSGLANLARVQGIEFRKDTVFAKKVLRSDREQTRRLDFGFSDRVRVYLNGRLLFRGDDPARSRDYRFLGSIGFWDALYLPLRAGDNEILLAVSEDHEDLGGWGVQAKLDQLTGLTLED